VKHISQLCLPYEIRVHNAGSGQRGGLVDIVTVNGHLGDGFAIVSGEVPLHRAAVVYFTCLFAITFGV
jgi:hypothetical protein